MPTEGEAGLSLTSFPTSHLVQVGGQPSNESGLAALPKLFKSLFSAGSSDSTPFTKHRSNSLDKSEVGHKEGNARRARTRTALADVPEDAEGQQLASHSKSPARPTRLSMLGRTNPSIGLTLQHDDAHSSNTNIPPATDQGSTFEGSASAYDLSSSLNRYNSRAQHDDAQSVTSFATSNHNRRAQHQHTDSDALNTVHQVIQKMKGGGISQSFWIPDESTTQCYACQLPFNTFRRKHHCLFKCL